MSKSVRPDRPGTRLVHQLMVVLFVALPAGALAQQPGLITPIGIIQVADVENGYVIKLDDRVLHSLARRDGLAPRLIAHYSDCCGSREVLVWERAVHDTSCTRRALFIIAIDKSGEATLTQEIRYCTDAERLVQQAGSRLTITIAEPRNGASRKRTMRRAWVFEKGRLTSRTGR